MKNLEYKAQFLRALKKILVDMDLGDIKKAARLKTCKKGAKLAAFILGCCYIDHIAGFYYGLRNMKESKYKSSKAFKRFVSKYLSKYNTNDLWKGLRCGLVHSYTANIRYGFTHCNSQIHLQQKRHLGKLRLMLNLENFIKDLEEATKKYFEDLKDDAGLFQKAKDRFCGNIGIMISDEKDLKKIKRLRDKLCERRKV